MRHTVVHAVGRAAAVRGIPRRVQRAVCRAGRVFDSQRDCVGRRCRAHTGRPRRALPQHDHRRHRDRGRAARHARRATAATGAVSAGCRAARGALRRVGRTRVQAHGGLDRVLRRRFTAVPPVLLGGRARRVHGADRSDAGPVRALPQDRPVVCQRAHLDRRSRSTEGGRNAT